MHKKIIYYEPRFQEVIFCHKKGGVKALNSCDWFVYDINQVGKSI